MQPIFDNAQIKASILQGIQDAKSSIEVAVAWFTDTELFSELVGACSRAKVCVLLHDDDINRNSRINWDDFTKKGGALYWYQPPSGIMHHKFCVVDGEKSYFGTYNWTFAAANNNHESLIILTGQPTANSFRAELKELLENPNTNPHSGTRAYFISSGLIGHPALEILRTEITLMEMVLAELEEKLAHQEGKLNRYEATLQKELAALLLEKIHLNEILAKAKAKLTKKQVYEDEAKDWRKEYEKTEETIKKAKIPKVQLGEQAHADMAQMYKQAIRLIHPDRFTHDPEKFTIATQITQELITAYKNGDIKRVEEIWQSIQKGWVFVSDLLKSGDIEALRSYLQKLKARQAELSIRLEALSLNETLIAANQYADFSEYVEICRRQLLRNIELLKDEIKNLENE